MESVGSEAAELVWWLLRSPCAASIKIAPIKGAAIRQLNLDWCLADLLSGRADRRKVSSRSGQSNVVRLFWRPGPEPKPSALPGLRALNADRFPGVTLECLFLEGVGGCDQVRSPEGHICDFLVDLNREDQGTGEASLRVDEPEQQSVQPPFSGDPVRKRKDLGGKLSLLLLSLPAAGSVLEAGSGRRGRHAVRAAVLQLQGRLQQQSEQLRQDLESAHRRSSQQLQSRLAELEASCKELTERKYKNEAAVRDLKIKLVGAEEVSCRSAWHAGN